MEIATCYLTSVAGSPYSPSRMHQVPKKHAKESPAEYEERTWVEKGHFLDSGEMYIPANCFKECLGYAAKMLSLKIPGKGNKLYTSHFVSGVQIADNGIGLGLTRKEILANPEKYSVSLFQNADGKKGSGKRVMRTFPLIPGWSGKLKYYLVDSTIPKDIFERVLRESGILTGVGRWRPMTGGQNGRYTVEKIVWKTTE